MRPRIDLTWLAVCVVCTIGVLACVTPPTSQRESATETAKAETPSGDREQPQSQAEQLETVPAPDLFALYNQNEIKADELAKGKRFIVAGTVKSIGKDIMGAPYITFESGSPVFGVQAMFPRNKAGVLADLLPGQQAQAACTGGGKLGNVILRDCELR